MVLPYDIRRRRDAGVDTSNNAHNIKLLSEGLKLYSREARRLVVVPLSYLTLPYLKALAAIAAE